MSSDYSSLVITAFISAAVSASVSYFVKRKENKDNAELAYSYEQKKKIKDEIGKHIGRTINSAEMLDARLTNLSDNYSKGWMNAKNPASQSGHYFSTTLQRLLSFYETVLSVEKNAIPLDSRYADPNDYIFLNYIAAFRYIFSDIRTIFEGLSYDETKESDHLYADNLRGICGRFAEVKIRERSAQEMIDFMDDKENANLIRLLDSLSPLDGRNRWDRFIILHLLLSAFLDSFGHARHKRTELQLREILARAVRIRVTTNLVNLLRNFDIVDTDAGRKLTSAIEANYRERTGSFLFL